VAAGGERVEGMLDGGDGGLAEVLELVPVYAALVF
jgi:hypothetical protein